jgi:hypothetical protein
MFMVFLEENMAAQIVKSSIKERIIEDALDFLESCGQPMIVEFIHFVNDTRNAGLLVAGPNPFLLNQIREHIGVSFPEEDFMEFTDALREHSFQHVFLYKIPPQEETTLRNLHVPAYIKQQLSKHKIKDRYNRPQLIWTAPKPVLASITRAGAPERHNTTMIFKWVETRTWEVTAANDIPKLMHERSLI